MIYAEPISRGFANSRAPTERQYTHESIREPPKENGNPDHAQHTADAEPRPPDHRPSRARRRDRGRRSRARPTERRRAGHRHDAERRAALRQDHRPPHRQRSDRVRMAADDRERSADRPASLAQRPLYAAGRADRPLAEQQPRRGSGRDDRPDQRATTGTSPDRIRIHAEQRRAHPAAGALLLGQRQSRPLAEQQHDPDLDPDRTTAAPSEQQRPYRSERRRIAHVRDPRQRRDRVLGQERVRREQPAQRPLYQRQCRRISQLRIERGRRDRVLGQEPLRAGRPTRREL